MRGRIGIAAGVVALLAWPIPGARGDSANGNDTAYAGSGSQHAEWHASDRSVRMWASPTTQMSTDRCMDAMLDWKHTSGSHYDSRVVRSCKPGAPIYTYRWSGDLVDDGADLDTSQVSWIEPLGDWNAANISETQKGYGYVIDDDYSGGTFDIYGEEEFAGAGSPNYTTVPRTCDDPWARVLTRYENGTYKGCKNFPANSATTP